MIKVVTLDLVIDDKLVGVYHFANRHLAEFFSKGLWDNISEEKQLLAQFRATEYEVCEDIDDMAYTLGRAIGFEDERIKELIEEAKKPE